MNHHACGSLVMILIVSPIVIAIVKNVTNTNTMRRSKGRRKMLVMISGSCKQLYRKNQTGGDRIIEGVVASMTDRVPFCLSTRPPATSNLLCSISNLCKAFHVVMDMV